MLEHHASSNWPQANSQLTSQPTNFLTNRQVRSLFFGDYMDTAAEEPAQRKYDGERASHTQLASDESGIQPAPTHKPLCL